ncbi:ATP-dependent zinc protease [Candidatus Saccharibacteria bacterium]|nr:ATP-dependent zinc protease [Candidatus Saccharibacteria bacterium]
MAQIASINQGTKNLGVIGSTEYVSIGKLERIPAKIDTGADSSSIWASDIVVKEDGTLTFKLFAPKSPYYTGEVLKSKEYTVSVIRSSNGNEQIRYRTTLPIKIDGHTVKAALTLADRSRNNFPILIGRRTISGKFLVDVSKTEVERPPKNPRTRPLNQELNEDPYEFHKKYMKKSK